MKDFPANSNYMLIELTDSSLSASHASFLAAVSDTIAPVHIKAQDVIDAHHLVTSNLALGCSG
jgi:hypothetical protein